MSIITKMRKQTATWWGQTSVMDDFGNFQFNAPLEISVRWEDVVTEFIDPNGDQQMSQGIVYVDRDVNVGDVLILSALTDVGDPDNPKENYGAWEIKRFDKLPSFKANEFLRTCYL
jgi:hypothetical protein